MYLNKVQLYGNMTKDPEVKALPSGVKVASFSIATNRTYKDKNGAKQENVQFHNIVCFGKTAELIEQYVKKGNPLYVEGRIETRSWEGKDEKKIYKTEIIVENFQFGPKSQGSGATDGKKYGVGDDRAAPPEEEEINIEDIPF